MTTTADGRAATMMYNEIRFAVSDGIATLTLDRPKKKNALSPTMNREILDAIEHVESDDTIRAFVMTGAGDSFCAGLDLDESFLRTFQQVDPARYRTVFEPILNWYLKLWNLRRPTIAAVNGHCYGGGLVPVSLCDVAVASENAVFALSEINFAHFPAGGTTWAASHFLLPKHFTYLCLSGDRIDAAEALRMGLITKVVPADELDTAVSAVATRLAQKHPSAYATAKKMCRMTPAMTFADAIDLEMAHIHENLFLSEGEMIEVALRQFEQKQIRPGAGESYTATH